jgi:hypothetical protein
MSSISWSSVLDWLAIALSAAATVCGLKAATVKVRDSIDDFIGDLRRQGRWAAAAAVGAALAVVAQVVSKIIA